MPGARVAPGAHIQKLVVQRSGPQRVDWGALIHRVKNPDLLLTFLSQKLTRPRLAPLTGRIPWRGWPPRSSRRRLRGTGS